MEKEPKDMYKQAPYQAQTPQQPKIVPAAAYAESGQHGQSVVWTKETVRKYVGQWVHCHSVYGMHHGIVHRALHDGFILVHHTTLASETSDTGQQFEAGVYQSDDDQNVEHVYLFPAPGMFIPYGGLFGLWPRPGFII